MTETTSNLSSPESWDNYWAGTANDSAYSNGGVNHPSIFAYWSTFFDEQSAKLSQGNAVALVDIACGNGALTAIALDKLENSTLAVTSVDISTAAIEQLANRFPNVNGIVSDVNKLSLEDEAFDFVVSQFGIEYAGDDAYTEAMRLTKKGGTFALMLHCKDGMIFQESKTNLEVINTIKSSKLLSISKALFDAGFEMLKGGERQKYEDSAKDFSSAILALEGLMRKYGKEVGGGFVFKLYNDLADIYESLSTLDPAGLMSWLENLDHEIAAYEARMASMVAAAMDESEFSELKTTIESNGFIVELADKLFSPDSPLPLAWVVRAQKS